MNCCPSLRYCLFLAPVLAAVVGLTLAPTAPTEAQDAGPKVLAMFGGTPQRNMANTVDKNIPSTWNVDEGKRKNIKWVAELGTTSYGGPVVAGGRVFAGTNNKKPRDPKIKGDKGVVMCFRESDGTFLWQAVHDKLPAQENDWPEQGVASVPAVDGDRLYYVSNRCEFVCASTDGIPDKKQAKIHWQLDMIKDLGVFPCFLANSSPLVVGDLVFALTGNGVDGEHELPAPKAASFVAVDKRTGKLAWQSSAPGAKIMDGQWSNPCYAEVNGKGQVIFPGGDGWLYSFEPATGKPIWKFNCNPKKSEYKPGGRGTRNYMIATPVIYENRLYLGTGQQPDHGEGPAHLWCIDLTKTGDISPVDDNFDPKAPVNKDSGLVWVFTGKADPKFAAESNREYAFGRTLSTCAIHDGLLYVAELAGFVHCLDARTGQPLWYHDMKTSTWGSPYYVDGKVFLGNDDGDVFVFAHGREKRLLNDKPIEMKRGIHSTPVAVNGVLYIMTDTHLYAIANQ